MKTVCAFCKSVIREGETPDDPVSHGVCRACYSSIMASHGIDLRRFLDMLDAPVILVDADVNVLAANTLAADMVKKPIGKITGNLCGKVFECRNARLPGGCGKTVYCSGCAIRNSVNETWQTGKPVERRPAVITRSLPGGEEKISLYVTTRKDGNAILLRIEPGEATPGRT